MQYRRDKAGSSWVYCKIRLIMKYTVLQYRTATAGSRWYPSKFNTVMHDTSNNEIYSAELLQQEVADTIPNFIFYRKICLIMKYTVQNSYSRE